MNKYSKDLFYDIIENHGITSKQGKRFLTSWNAIKQNLNCPFFGNRWDDLESRRPLTRDFYEHLLNKPSGFMTKARIFSMTLSLTKPKRQNLPRPRFIWTDI